MGTLENNTTDDYDSPWKEGMELYFKELMQFFFPDIDARIAWDKGYQFLDKELQQVVRDAEIGRNDTPGSGPSPGRWMSIANMEKYSAQEKRNKLCKKNFMWSLKKMRMVFLLEKCRL
jgi:hypothetical protein